MKTTRYLAFALALAVVGWPPPPAGAESRCYPSKRFKVVGDQWVLDTLTKLVWQRQVSTPTMNLAAAKAYCLNAGLRLPTAKELLSIVDFTVPSPGPTIDHDAFPNTPAESFWTSSLNSLPALPRVVSFENGSSGSSVAGSLNGVRCVR